MEWRLQEICNRHSMALGFHQDPGLSGTMGWTVSSKIDLVSNPRDNRGINLSLLRGNVHRIWVSGRNSRIDPVDGLPGVRQADDEHVALGHHTVQHDPEFSEVHLSFNARRVLLRDENLDTAPGLNIDLGPADPHIVTDGRV